MDMDKYVMYQTTQTMFTLDFLPEGEDGINQQVLHLVDLGARNSELSEMVLAVIQFFSCNTEKLGVALE